MKKDNYKYLIGFILGILLCGGSVYAAIMYSSNIVIYDNTSSTLNSNNVQAAIDELAARSDGSHKNKLAFAKKNTLSVGDYIIYTPNKTSYTTDTTQTGDTIVQTINPSELTVWRVLKLNYDGTVDIISEDVSSVAIYFKGQKGYQNFVGYLNVLASQYENSAYTVGSRHFGYDGQTKFITNTTYFKKPAPWTCSTGGTCSPDPDDYEAYGGGDSKYVTDYNLLYLALGNKTVNTVGTSTVTDYWIASRRYSYSDADNYYWFGRYVRPDGTVGNASLYDYRSGSALIHSNACSLRPIVTLKSGLSYYGIGTKDYPMEIVSNN